MFTAAYVDARMREMLPYQGEADTFTLIAFFIVAALAIEWALKGKQMDDQRLTGHELSDAAFEAGVRKDAPLAFVMIAIAALGFIGAMALVLGLAQKAGG